jgi:hypothetical protein
MNRICFSNARLKGLLILGVLLVGVWYLATPSSLELRVEPVTGGAPLLVVPLDDGEGFTLHYIHSVDREPIWEVHSVDSTGQIFIEEERFVMVGAGMGDLPGRGRWTGSGGLQSIKDMHYPIGEFVLRIGSPGVDHTILWRDTRINLTTMAAGTAVLVSAHPVKRYYSIWRRMVPHAATPQPGAVDVRSNTPATD